MAEEVQYESNKRKYEVSPSPVGRRASGFSSAPDSAAPTPAYNSVPPPLTEIELAKQKAQEIAARLLSNVDPLKRARFENGGGGGFDVADAGMGQKPLGLGLSGPPQAASYGYPGPSKKIEVPNNRVGVIIGKGGETIKYLQLQSGAKIQVTRDMDADPNSATRGVELTGTPAQIAKAEQLINDALNEADAGGSGATSRRLTGPPPGAEQFVMKVPNNKVGLVIGKGGEAIKNMQARSGARIQVIPLHLPPGDLSQERTVQIDGTSEQIEAAKVLVNEVISENRMRNSSGGYSQQGYQARPPTNWAQPGPPIQQPGYGYVQPGAYPGPSPQYMNQPPYSGYPPQPTSGGYASSWDQSTAPQNQQAAQGGGYDYYNQQPPPQQQQAPGGPDAPTDGSAYGYGQPPTYSQAQGYGQDGYGGYSSTYGSVPNPTPDSQAPSYGTQGDTNQAAPLGQSYSASSQPNPNPNYPPQTSSQPGYGVPPSSQGSYGAQYGSYGVPPYGAPSATQPSYAQQPPPYNSTYGSGYSQPPAYASADGSTGANAHGVYDVTPPQSAPPSGAAEASPPS